MLSGPVRFRIHCRPMRAWRKSDARSSFSVIGCLQRQNVRA